MKANRRMIQSCCLAVPCAVIALVPLMAQRLQPLEISVIDGRPLSAVISQLETRYGWTITYEDPPYESPFDVDDVTSQVARDPKNFKGKVLVPRTREFDFKYPNADQSQAEAVLTALVRDYNMVNLDRFRLLRTDKFFHVVPSVSNDKTGQPTERQSRLDVRVTIPDADRSVLETVELVVTQVRERSGAPLVAGRLPINLLSQKRLRTGATKEPARDVLVRALTSTGRDLTWRIPCDPGGTNKCFFDVHFVRPSE
jgi:hypothetical protein